MNKSILSGRFHFVYIANFIRSGLFLCLIPLLQALLRWDLAAVQAALQKDLVILACLAAVAVLLWRGSGFWLTERALTFRSGVLLQRQTVLLLSQVAVLELQRPLWLRLLGATRVRLYAAEATSGGQHKLYLTRTQAAALAARTLPLPAGTVFHDPRGLEQLSFTFLSANILTTAVLIWFSARQTGKIFGPAFERLLAAIALDNLLFLEQWVELLLPAGVAWVVTLGFVFWGLALGWSALATANFTVAQTGLVLVSKGGRLNHYERRVRTAAITSCQLRIGITARILRRQPVYFSAGCYTSELPILAYAVGNEALVQQFFPQFWFRPPAVPPLGGRSLGQFLWKSSTALVLSLAVAGVSLWQLPQLTPLLMVPCFVCLVWCLVSLEGFFCEGVCHEPAHPLALQYSKGLARHWVCVFAPPAAIACQQTPFLQQAKRCNLRLHLAGRKRFLVRGVCCTQAEQLRL